ncbi:UNVERIFIED_CONTAM: hypothetical protein Sradi_0076800 [Sesamum radiatum]|uniref:DNA-directed RNA polymerase I subunit rpa49 n=1 Tax=Sesamum radiatum TaxID=300843 RepID=A0AAW2WHN0_SESRA
MAKSKEKRKKSSLTEEEVSKRGKKFEALDVKIKTIGENPDQKAPPIVGYFPSGYDPLKNSDDSDSRPGERTSVKVYKSANSRNPRNPRMQVVVGVNGSQVNFVGSNYFGEATTPQLCNYALGVLDKETRVLTMVPIAANRDVKRETLRQTEGPGPQEDVDQELKGIEINTEALEAITSTTNSRNVPPYDLDATSPDKAYPLDKIILKGEWDYLLDVFELAEAGLDESKKRRFAGILSYITHLIKFKDRHSMDGVTSAKRHKLPSILSQKFSSLFGATNDTRIPDDKLKLLISYILVLSLFADDFRSDPSDIAKDLRMNPIH